MDTGNGIGVSPLGKKVRIGHRVRGTGLWGVCSARFLNAYNPLSTTAATYAGGFQVRFPEGSSSATAQNASGESADVSE